MKASQIAAKIVTRLFLILLLVALVPLLQGDNSKMQHIYLAPQHLWTLAPPILLILGFIILLIVCARQKYSQQDLNWLLVLNTVILIIYGITLYIRVYQMIN
ncbi:hypothetical protein ACFQZX_11870 [Mucilaginibacter litoreus]|uniref:Uncharacterized protein n=1 Tax=Mucilaginibacter litoreus TaxID=1048221 RepID=A0ABW3ATD3_9SPHI